MILVVLAGLSGVASMARGIARREGVGWRSLVGSRPALARSARAAWAAVARESLGQDRFREGVRGGRRRRSPGTGAAGSSTRVTVWGFLGLLAATLLDYGLALVGIKATGDAGADLVPGPPARHGGRRRCWSTASTSLIVDRYRAQQPVRQAVDDRRLDAARPALGDRRDRASSSSSPSTCRARPPGATGSSCVHVAVAMELVLLAPFMKLAHAVYRPVALFFVALAKSTAEGDA